MDDFTIFLIILSIIIIIVIIFLVVFLRESSSPVPPIPPVPPECLTNQDCLSQIPNKPVDSYCRNGSCQKLSEITCSTNNDCPLINEILPAFYPYNPPDPISRTDVLLHSFCYQDNLSQPGYCVYGQSCTGTCDLAHQELYIAPIIFPNNTYSKFGQQNMALSQGDPSLGCASLVPGGTEVCTD